MLTALLVSPRAQAGRDATYDNTQVTASKNLTVKSGSDTNLIGAQLAGETVKMEVGTSGKGALNIETLQDKSAFESKQSSTGFDMSLCIPPICYGMSTVSVNVSQQAIDHNYISAVGQSGIAAGKGGFDIAVAGNTDLKGAAITSSASADKNTLATQSLTSSDLANAQSTSASSSSVTVGNNVAAMVVSNVLANLAGKDGLPENANQSGKTLSVISPASVTITGTGNASTDATSGQQVALLTHRDASTANGALKNTLTLQQALGLQAQQKELQDNMQAGQLVGSVAYNMAGDIAAKNQWADSSPQKIALHAIAGLIQASAAGRNGAAGALAGAANEALTKTVNEAIDKAMALPANATPEQVRENAQSRKTLAEGAAQLIGMGAVALGGGSAQDVRLGGAVALNADRFNRQLHPSETKRIKDLAGGDANKEARLTAAACALVHCADSVPKDDPSYNFLNKLQDSGANLTDEKLLLSQQQGWIGRNHQSLFQYTGVDEYIIDPATQNKIGPRLAGAAQATVGIVGVAGSGTLCTTGVGCVLGAVSGTVSADYAVAGVKQAVTGNAALPYGEQVLQSLGLSPQAAAYTYAALGVAPSALPAAAQSIKNIAPQLDAILLNAQSKIGQSIDDAAANLARNSTHAAGDANRVVLGKWEGDYGGYVGDAKLNGGVWYQTDPGVWDKMTKGFSDVEKTAVAWKVNESFLKQQLQAGIPKFEFVGTTIETIKAGRPSFALMEVNFLEANAAKFGYRKIENAWVKVN